LSWPLETMDGSRLNGDSAILLPLSQMEPKMAQIDKEIERETGKETGSKMGKEMDKLVIAISSRALFDLSESHQVFEEQGLEAYQQYQIAREDEPLQPGDAFVLVNKLLRLNSLLGAPRV